MSYNFRYLTRTTLCKRFALRLIAWVYLSRYITFRYYILSYSPLLFHGTSTRFFSPPSLPNNLTPRFLCVVGAYLPLFPTNFLQMRKSPRAFRQCSLEIRAPRSPLNISITVRKPIFLKCGRRNYRRQNTAERSPISFALPNSSFCSSLSDSSRCDFDPDFREINTGQRRRGFFLSGVTAGDFRRRYNAIATRADVAFGQ